MGATLGSLVFWQAFATLHYLVIYSHSCIQSKTWQLDMMTLQLTLCSGSSAFSPEQQLSLSILEVIS